MPILILCFAVPQLSGSGNLEIKCADAIPTHLEPPQELESHCCYQGNFAFDIRAPLFLSRLFIYLLIIFYLFKQILIAFVTDLINDWSSRSPSDIIHFVPYTWILNFSLKEFELVTVANQYNWVDCSSQLQENGSLH